MKSATLGDAPYQVPRENKRWPAIGLAVAMHAGLFAMLWIGVHWQNDQPIAVEAEVWDMKVQSAAPPPPPPVEAPEPTPPPAPARVQPPPVAAPVETPPQPNPVDIALEKKKAKLKAEQEQKAEQARQQKLEDEAQAKADKLAKAAKEKADAKAEAKAKALAEQKAQDEADAKAAKAAEKAAAEKKAALDKADKAEKAKRTAAEAKKTDDAHKAEMARLQSTFGSGTSGTAAKSTAPRQDSGYVAAITAKIKGNIAFSGSTDAPGNPRAVYKITQLPTGEIISVRKVKSSGVPAFDSAVENAISKSSPLPKKKDGTVERDIDAIFDMKDTP